jgi:hypothetical protein
MSEKEFVPRISVVGVYNPEHGEFAVGFQEMKSHIGGGHASVLMHATVDKKGNLSEYGAVPVLSIAGLRFEYHQRVLLQGKSHDGLVAVHSKIFNALNRWLPDVPLSLKNAENLPEMVMGRGYVFSLSERSTFCAEDALAVTGLEFPEIKLPVIMDREFIKMAYVAGKLWWN